MWLPRSIIAIILVLTVQACGFTPVYKSGSDDGDNTNRFFADVKVAPIEFGILGQQLRAHLQDELHPAGGTVVPKYRLEVTLEQSIQPLIIEQDRTIARYNLVVIAKYSLYRIDDNKAVHKGRSRMVGSYDAEVSDFATYAAQEDTAERVMQEIARDIRFRLTTYFSGKE